jgi:hypothetical protein
MSYEELLLHQNTIQLTDVPKSEAIWLAAVKPERIVATQSQNRGVCGALSKSLADQFFPWSIVARLAPSLPLLSS